MAGHQIKSAEPRILANGLMLITFGLKQEIIVWENERGLLYRDGRYEKLLQPGRYDLWRIGDNVLSHKTDTHFNLVGSQEILTADKVEVRVSLVAQYVVTDPPLAVNTVESYTDQLYQELQLALREAVASRSIDQLLEAREEIGNTLRDQIAPRVLEFGITLRRIGVRDIVLPGVVRNVF